MKKIRFTKKERKALNEWHKNIHRPVFIPLTMKLTKKRMATAQNTIRIDQQIKEKYTAEEMNKLVENALAVMEARRIILKVIDIKQLVIFLEDYKKYIKKYRKKMKTRTMVLDNILTMIIGQSRVNKK